MARRRVERRGIDHALAQRGSQVDRQHERRSAKDTRQTAMAAARASGAARTSRRLIAVGGRTRGRRTSIRIDRRMFRAIVLARRTRRNDRRSLQIGRPKSGQAQDRDKTTAAVGWGVRHGKGAACDCSAIIEAIGIRGHRGRFFAPFGQNFPAAPGPACWDDSTYRASSARPTRPEAPDFPV